ncbi:MAG: CHAT domain-containing protein [Phycisphaerales bacterium]
MSHAWADKPVVEPLVNALIARGVDAWYDGYEVGPGDDIVEKMNNGLAKCDVGLLVFSRNTDQGRWVKAEINALFHARVEEGKVLIPVIVGDDAKIPPLVKPLARVRIEEIDRIHDAIHHRRVKPPLGSSTRAPAGSTSGLSGPSLRHDVRISLSRASASTNAIDVQVEIDGETIAKATHTRIPDDLAQGCRDFATLLADLPSAATPGHRAALATARTAREASMVRLGSALAAFCLPGDAGGAVAALLANDAARPGSLVAFVVESSDPELLSLPFEAMREPGGALIVEHPGVTMVRRPPGLAWTWSDALAGPLKILVAVGAPDEGTTRSSVLDHERELSNILDGVEPAQRLENVQVRVLEASEPTVIGEALRRDQFHILHLTCHGNGEVLELDDEDGRPVMATADELLAAFRAAGRLLPMVFLSACHSGASTDSVRAASVAEQLLRGGVPAVLAMQGAVSDRYGSELAREFFERMAATEGVLASEALAQARRALEQARRQRLARGTAGAAGIGGDVDWALPEYATAALFVAGIEAPLANFGPDREPLRVRPVQELAGPVPQLDLDDLIGRRREMRETLRALRDQQRRAGVVIAGIGGVGKSTIAGRAMRRLVEDGFAVAAHRGRWELGSVTTAMATAMTEKPALRDLAALLTRPTIDERVRLKLVEKALAEHPVVLVLDDFEQNLTIDGSAFVTEDIAAVIAALVAAAKRGRLLITSRHPLPPATPVIASRLATIHVGPLTDAEVRKLLIRLPGLSAIARAELVPILRTIGNHPRMLEFLDAIVRGGTGRLEHVTEKLREVAAREGVALDDTTPTLTEAARQTILLGARDVFLGDLLDSARRAGIDEVLLQASVSNLPVTADGVAHMLADGAAPEDVTRIDAALDRLEAMSLVYRQPAMPRAAWIHRWTAQGLAALVDSAEHRERHARAGRYRLSLVQQGVGSIDDAIEAVKNFLAGRDFDAAGGLAELLCDLFAKGNSMISVAALASEVLETLPTDHPSFGALADAEGRAHLALGEIDRAKKRYEQLHHVWTARAAAHPARADCQRDLSVSHNKMGDLYSALGLGEQARASFQRSLDIIERLAAAEPGRADYQRDLSVSHNKMGDLYSALGLGEQARTSFQRALDTRERLAAAEPGRADYQRDLSVSHNRMGDLYSAALGLGEQARTSFQRAARDLRTPRRSRATTRPTIRGNSPSHTTGWATCTALLGLGEQARASFQRALDIRERLAAAEQDAPTTRGTSPSRTTRWATCTAPSDLESRARASFQRAHDIRERLAAAEPGRARLPEGPLRLAHQDGRPVHRPRTWRAGSRILPASTRHHRTPRRSRARTRRLPKGPCRELRADGDNLCRGRVPSLDRPGDRRSAARRRVRSDRCDRAARACDCAHSARTDRERRGSARRRRTDHRGTEAARGA